MEPLIIYTTTADFNPNYDIKLISVITGSVTLQVLTHEDGTVCGTIGTVTAGDVRAISMGKATLRVVAAASTQYVIA